MEGSTGPSRRLILLGASNLVRSLATIVATARNMWGGPMEIMAAIGHGRSFGQSSWVLGRKIPGIFSCALWDELKQRPPMPTAALVTDVGNDILYGVQPKRLLGWVEGCLDRLTEVDADIVVTELPVTSIDRLGETSFVLLRTLLFPRSDLTLADARHRARQVNEGLSQLATRQKTALYKVQEHWYGFDAIHSRRRHMRVAWPQIMTTWNSQTGTEYTPSHSWWQAAYMLLLPPWERSIFGFTRHRQQPSGQLADGTTISLY